MKKCIVAVVGLLINPFSFALERDPITSEIVDLIQNSKPRLQVVHCVEGTTTCRKLVLLSDLSGRPINSFYMVFSSLDLHRLTGAVEYMLENNDGTFRSRLHEGLTELYHGLPGATEINTENHKDNSRLKVSFDRDGFPKIHEMRLARHGTKRFSIASLSFSSEDSVLDGIEHDPDDSTFERKVHITYKRTKVLEPKIP